MKKILLILLSLNLFSQQSYAITLSEALLQTYKNNTELSAERENINISKKDLKISKSEYLPSVTISSSKSKEDTNKLTNRSGADVATKNVNPLTSSIIIQQTLIDLGRSAEIKKLHSTPNPKSRDFQKRHSQRLAELRALRVRYLRNRDITEPLIYNSDIYIEKFQSIE